MTRITHCEVCGNKALLPSVDLGRHPMCDDLVPIGEERTCVEYPIRILYCRQCRTAHQEYQIPKAELFPPSYHYRARHTGDVLNGMAQLADASEALLGSVAGRSVLDIGCNDGSLLSIFAARGARTIGVEPTDAADDAIAGGHAVEKGYFDEDLARRLVSRHGHPDLITFTNVFAHIEDLPEVMRAIAVLRAPHTALVIENHYLGAILTRDQFDTFYHEHPRTYSYQSFTVLADQLGMRIARVEFPGRYGGNIRVAMVRRIDDEPHDRIDELRTAEASFEQGLLLLDARVRTWRSSKRRRIDEWVRRYGPLYAKAFPGRAAIPIKLLGLTTAQIQAVFEKPASAKIGHYVPGTRIPIRSDDAFEGCDGPLLNLAWHIAGEIRAYMRDRGFHGEIVDILEPADFAEPGSGVSTDADVGRAAGR